MATTKKRIAAYVTDDTVKKFKIVAATKNKSMSEYAELLIMKAVEGYEIENGIIKIEAGEQSSKTINIGHDNVGTINM